MNLPVRGEMLDRLIAQNASGELQSELYPILTTKLAGRDPSLNVFVVLVIGAVIVYSQGRLTTRDMVLSLGDGIIDALLDDENLRIEARQLSRKLTSRNLVT